MCVVHPIPEVDECVVYDLEHVDHKLQSNGNGSIRGYFVQRRRVYGGI
jgi:hypothetical protein